MVLDEHGGSSSLSELTLGWWVATCSMPVSVMVAAAGAGSGTRGEYVYGNPTHPPTYLADDVLSLAVGARGQHVGDLQGRDELTHSQRNPRGPDRPAAYRCSARMGLELGPTGPTGR